MAQAVSVDAVYQGGVLKPLRTLGLRENERVRIRIVRRPAEQAETVEKETASLHGAFPELAAISDEAIEEIKMIWEEGLEKQIRILESSGDA